MLFADFDKASAPACEGKKVFVKITKWFSDHAEGVLSEIIGEPGIHETEMRAIVLERGFAYEYPVEVVREAEAIAKNAEKIRGRGSGQASRHARRADVHH